MSELASARSVRSVAGALVLVLAASASGAQPRVAVAEDVTGDRPSLAIQVRQMERGFEDAVTRGIRSVEQGLAGLSLLTPGGALFAGSIRARGFVLDDYGVFFDVEYPVLRRSVIWSMRMLDPMDTGLAEVIAQLRQRLELMPAGPGQVAFGQAIEDLEIRFGVSGDPTGLPGGRRASDSNAIPRDRLAVDVGDTYLDALTTELTGALVRAGHGLALTPDAWLTVAARDGRGGRDARFPSPSQTLHLRIRSRDLDAFRQGRLTADDTARRVEVRRR